MYCGGAACQRQINHPGRVLLNDLISLGVSEDGGDHGQVLLYRGLPNGFAPICPLPQFCQHILQCDGPQAVDGDGPDEGYTLSSIRW